MAASSIWLGASTPFGKIIALEPILYNAQATVRSKDGTVNTYRLPFLIAHGAKAAR